MTTIIPPTAPTLKKHGLTLELWQELLGVQGGACGACGKVPKSNKLNIDHEHVRGYYSMEPELRRTFIRGLVCYMCNKFRLARGSTAENLLHASMYLRDYAERKANAAKVR